MLGKLPEYESKERPIINSLYIPSKTMPEPRRFDLNTLIYWVKRTPECIGIVKRIATDIVTNISFVSVADQKTGRPSKNLKIKTEDKAVEFALRNSFKKKLEAAVIDRLITGDFYLWKGKISDNQIKEVTNKHLAEYGYEMKEFEAKQFFDEDFNGINTIELIPSSMVEIFHDQFKITEYVQKSKSNPARDRKFKPDEIIHGKLMEIDGSVYGFSPMESAYTGIRIINSIQDYSYYYFENGAKIDRVWKFMGNVNQAYLDKFKETLKKYVSTKKSHGSLLISGADKIESESLNEISEEMEYRQLAIHSVGRLAFAFNMPADILSAILGVDVKGTAIGSDVEDAGYNRNVEQAQAELEDLMNSQLFISEFKVEMRLERTFKQGQIMQTQYMAQTIPVIEFLFKHEIPVSDEYIYSMLQIPRKYLTEGKIKREIEVDMGMPFKQPGGPPKGPGQQAFSDRKKAEQKPQQNNRPPIGK